MSIKTLGHSIAEYITKAHKLSPRVHAGVRSKAFGQAGTESLLGLITLPIANRVLGPKKFKKFLFKYLHEPVRKADAVLGKVAEDISRHTTPLDKMFIQKEMVPMGKTWHREIERPSILAPVTKVRDIAVPIVIGLESEKLLRKHHDMKDQELRKQAAAKMLQLHEENKQHEKRAWAIRLIYKQAESGIFPVPRTFSELQEKVASLMKEDLNVMEKAMEMSQSVTFQKMGSLDSDDTSSGEMTAEIQFRASIVN